MNIHQWMHNIKTFNASFSKHSVIHKQWNVNTIANIPRFHRSNSIWRLEGQYRDQEKAVVLVGASPRLSQDIRKLKDLDDDFRIICANSSLKYLLRNGIKPDYVICLDSDHQDIPQHLDIDRDDITLLASTVVLPSVLDNWKGPIYYIPYYSIDNELKSKVRNRLGKSVASGGNSMTSAFIIATLIFGSWTVIYVGNELCFDNKKEYYADKTTAKSETLMTRYNILDVNGNERCTTAAHYNYAMWTEKMSADLSPPGFFIDTSFGILGRGDSVIHVMELSRAIAVVKGAFAVARDLKKEKSELGRLKILQEITPEDDDQSEVYRYNMHEQRERLLQFARS